MTSLQKRMEPKTEVGYLFSQVTSRFFYLIPVGPNVKIKFRGSDVVRGMVVTLLSGRADTVEADMKLEDTPTMS